LKHQTNAFQAIENLIIAITAYYFRKVAILAPIKSATYGFYVVFPVKHIFNQAVAVSEHIDFTPYLHVSRNGDRRL
jgi:hypothetical protein